MCGKRSVRSERRNTQGRAFVERSCARKSNNVGGGKNHILLCSSLGALPGGFPNPHSRSDFHPLDAIAQASNVSGAVVPRDLYACTATGTFCSVSCLPVRGIDTGND
ncbi:hypothetical protein B0G38_000372 [Arthrobacter sp. VKM Ac-2550]|nr:hypothetical protein [Arthrobacter sp. VKM Ac-2550]